MKPLSVTKAQMIKVCRYCLETNSPILREDGSTNAFVFNFGNEYAHKDCIPKPPLNKTVQESIIGDAGIEALKSLSERKELTSREEAQKHILAQPSNPCGEIALRFNKGKPKVSYMLHYPKVAEVIGRILEVGEVKYEPLNWKKGGNTDESYLDAAIRHLFKFVNGEPFDNEYGTHHLGHAIWNLMTMFELNIHEVMDVDKFNEAIKKLKEVKDARKTDS